MPAPVYASVRKVLAELPEDVQTSVDAVCALALAESIENQIGGAAAVKELRAIMAGLREKKVAGDELDDLVARRAARSATAQAG